MHPPRPALAGNALGRHVESLDGVRAFAILVVLLVHAGTPGFKAGWIGVDLFFALSGFLITTLLLEERARRGRIAYGSFLVRRALRLMPAYFVYAGLVTYAIWGWSGSERHDHGGWSPETFTVALWTYAINFVPMGGIWNGQAITVHLWSLAVEQQYYLVWPLVVVAFALRPVRLAMVGGMLTALSLGAFLFAPAQFQAAMLFTRGFTLVLASTIAALCFHHRSRIADRPLGRYALPGIAVVMAAFVMSQSGWSEAEVRTRLLPGMSLAFCVWIASLWYRPVPALVAPVLLNPWVQYVGKVSYGIYLFHELVRVAVWEFAKPLMTGWNPSLGYGVRLGIYLALSVLVAALSYRLVELPFLRLRGVFRPASVRAPAVAPNALVPVPVVAAPGA